MCSECFIKLVGFIEKEAETSETLNKIKTGKIKYPIHCQFF